MDTSNKFAFFLFVFLACGSDTAADTFDDAKLNVEQISGQLMGLLDGGLGVNDMTVYLSKNLKYLRTTDAENILDQAATALGTNVQARQTAALALKDKLVSLYPGFTTKPSVTACCQISKKSLTYNAVLADYVDFNHMCYRTSPSTAATAPFISPDVLDVFQNNKNKLPQVSYQYYGTEEGLSFFYPAFRDKECNVYDPRVRPWYKSAIAQRVKNVVILLDSTADMFTVQSNGVRLFDLAKQAIGRLLGRLSPADGATVISFSTLAVPPRTYGGEHSEEPIAECYGADVANCKESNVRVMKAFMNRIRPSTNDRDFVAALSTAAEFLYPSNSGDETTIFSSIAGLQRLIVIFTCGKDNINADTDILSVIERINKQTGSGDIESQVSISVFLVGQTDTLTTQFLTLLTNHQQNQPGIYATITGGTAIDEQLRGFFSHVSTALSTTNETAGMSSPYYDYSKHVLINSITVPVYDASGLRGVVAIDMVVQDALNSVTHVLYNPFSYLAVVERVEQNVLSHPLLPHPMTNTVSNDVLLVKLDNVMRSSALRLTVFPGLLYGSQNSLPKDSSLNTNLYNTYISAAGNTYQDALIIKTARPGYWYRPVAGTTLSILLVYDQQPLTYDVKLQAPVDNVDFVYHQLTYLQQDPAVDVKLCKSFYAQNPAGHSVVKFSPDVFQDLNLYGVETYQDYLHYRSIVLGTTQDDTFKAGVVTDVQVTTHLNTQWTTGDYSIDKVPQAVYRYIGTERGVFRVFPGGQMPKAYDPRNRDWYIRAKAVPGQIAMSPPYLDSDGGGLILTISQALVEEPGRTDIYGVMGIDVTIHYAYSFLQTVDVCSTQGYDCLIMTSAGQILMYGPWIQAEWTQPPPVENTNILELVPRVGWHMLYNSFLVQDTCLHLFETLDRRYLKRGSQYPNNLINVLYVDGALYAAKKVPNVNAYVVLYSTANLNAIEPCSCKRDTKVGIGPCQYSAGSCECPCYVASTIVDVCLQTVINPNKVYYPCPPVQYNPWDGVPDAYTVRTVALTPCLDAKCHDITTENDCNARGMCRWCSYTTAGTKSKKPFCGLQQDCWFGQIGSTWLYYRSTSVVQIIMVVTVSVACFLLIVCCITYTVRRWQIALHLVEYYMAVGVIVDKRINVKKGERRRPPVKEQRENDMRAALMQVYHDQRYSIVAQGFNHPHMVAFREDDDATRTVTVTTDPLTEKDVVKKTSSQLKRESIFKKQQRTSIFVETERRAKNSVFITDLTLTEMKEQLRHMAEEGKPIENTEQVVSINPPPPANESSL